MRGNKRRCLQWLSDQPEGTYEVKAFNKRSLSQNSYYWELISQLGEVTGKTNDELHLEMLRDYSTAKMVACKSYVDVRDFVRYCEVDYIDEEQEVTYWRLYKGSSEMNTKEFKRLLDGVIEECRNCGIETMTPEEIGLLKKGG